jgi:hypothetical protein
MSTIIGFLLFNFFGTIEGLTRKFNEDNGIYTSCFNMCEKVTNLQINSTHEDFFNYINCSENCVERQSSAITMLLLFSIMISFYLCIFNITKNSNSSNEVSTVKPISTVKPTLTFKTGEIKQIRAVPTKKDNKEGTHKYDE